MDIEINEKENERMSIRVFAKFHGESIESKVVNEED